MHTSGYMPVDPAITIVLGLTFENWPRTLTGDDCLQKAPRRLVWSELWPLLHLVCPRHASLPPLCRSLKHFLSFLIQYWKAVTESYLSWHFIHGSDKEGSSMLADPCQSGYRILLVWDFGGKKRKKQTHKKKVASWCCIFPGIICFVKCRLRGLLADRFCPEFWPLSYTQKTPIIRIRRDLSK